jgi:hypothetical protein
MRQRSIGSDLHATEHAAKNAVQHTTWWHLHDCWLVLHTALNSAGIAASPGFTTEFVFRQCQQCGQTNGVKKMDFTCAVCDAALPSRTTAPKPLPVQGL